jgi:heat shock protein HtpX
MKSVTKAWFFLIAISLTLIVLGHILGGREGLLFFLILALGINSFVYFYEDRRVLSTFNGKTLDGQDSYGLHDMARRLSIKSRIKTPQILLLPSHAPQAGIIGNGLSRSSLLITQGLLDKLSMREIEAVIAYQIASISNLNTLSFAVGSFLTSISLLITSTLDTIIRLLIVEKKNPKNIVSQFFTRLTAPIFGSILKLSIRKSFYKEADALAAELLDDSQVLAKVLWKLESFSETLPLPASVATAHIFIVSPLTQYRWERFFVTQPQTKERIRQLVGYYPL